MGPVKSIYWHKGEVKYAKPQMKQAFKAARDRLMGPHPSSPHSGNQLLASSRLARERWERITEILSAACELPPESRLSYIAQLCGSDAPVRSEVERLLREVESMSGFLEEPAELPAPRQRFSRARNWVLTCCARKSARAEWASSSRLSILAWAAGSQ